MSERPIPRQRVRVKREALRDRRDRELYGGRAFASELARHGWHIATFPAEELFMGNGGAHCMTCPVEVG